MDNGSFWILNASELDQLCEQSYLIRDNFFSAEQVLQIASVFNDFHQSFRPAQIGAGLEPTLEKEVRGDKILWWDSENTNFPHVLGTFQIAYLDLIRLQLKLPVFNLEMHWACYPPGAGYSTHLDQTPQLQLVVNRRVLSFVLYLNKDWQPGDGGELEIWPDSEFSQKIAPIWNRAIFFFSERVPHRVLPAIQKRQSLTGWFKTLPS